MAKMTERQKRFCDESENINCLKTTLEHQTSKTMRGLKAAEMLLGRYKFSKSAISESEKVSILIDSIAILLGEYEITRKYAAMLLLKHLMPIDIVKEILRDERIYPIERKDSRVREWTKEIIKKGCCEKCGSTKNLEAHHILRWADYPKGRIDLNNGACLCHSCHTEEHFGEPSYHMMKSKVGEVSNG